MKNEKEIRNRVNELEDSNARYMKLINGLSGKTGFANDILRSH